MFRRAEPGAGVGYPLRYCLSRWSLLFILVRLCSLEMERSGMDALQVSSFSDDVLH